MVKKKIILMIAGIGIFGVFCNIRCPEARAASVRINETNFPDLYFRAYVEAEFDKNGDGKLDYGERAAVKKLDVGETSEYRLAYEYLPAETLKGIEYFPNLETLDCSSSMLDRLNVSNNKKLKTLRCQTNALTKLDVSENKKLVLLNCRDNRLKKLNVSKNRRLTQLYVSGNRIKKLDVTRLKKLQELSADQNRLRKLDLKNNRLLHYLSCADNQIITGNLGIGRKELEYVNVEQQSCRIRVKKRKGGYLVPLPGLAGTNALSHISKGKAGNKGIRLRGKKLPKKITYQYNMFTNGKKKTRVTLYLKK